MVTGGSALAEPCAMERLYDFENLAFREYIAADAPPAMRIVDLATEMGAHEHPLVQYAAASAFFGVALNRPPLARQDPPAIPWETRETYVARAQQLWSGAEPQLRACYEQGGDHQVAAGYWAFSVRAQLAQAHVPSMRIGAAWYGGGEHVSEEQVASATTQSLQGDVNVARQVLDDSDPLTRGARVKLCRELLGGMLLQRGDWLMVPATLRQQQPEPRPWTRADWMAVDLAPPHRQTMVKVYGKYDPSRSAGAKLSIDAYADLRCDNAEIGFRLLAAAGIYALGGAEAVPPDWRSQITEIAGHLHNRLATHIQRGGFRSRQSESS